MATDLFPEDELGIVDLAKGLAEVLELELSGLESDVPNEQGL